MSPYHHPDPLSRLRMAHPDPFRPALMTVSAVSMSTPVSMLAVLMLILVFVSMFIAMAIAMLVLMLMVIIILMRLPMPMVMHMLIHMLLLMLPLMFRFMIMLLLMLIVLFMLMLMAKAIAMVNDQKSIVISVMGTGDRDADCGDDVNLHYLVNRGRRMRGRFMGNNSVRSPSVGPASGPTLRNWSPERFQICARTSACRFRRMSAEVGESLPELRPSSNKPGQIWSQSSRFVAWCAALP